MANNLLVVHGGGTTAAINASLYGVLTEAQKAPEVDKIYAAKNGTGGSIERRITEFDKCWGK